MSREERAIRLQRAQKKITLLSAVVGYTASWWIASSLSGPLFWLALLFGGAGLTWLFYFVAMILSTYEIYKGNLDEIFGAQADENPVEDERPTIINLEIVGHPEQPVGRYMDCEFFEWLDFKTGDDSTIRAHFFGTVDLKREVHIPSGCLLLSPGILYKIEPEDSQVDAN